MEKVELLIKYIKESEKTVFFSGAGVSTASGLKDFRSVDGLYNEKYKFPPEQILSHDFFIKNPSYFYEFYKEKLNSLKYKPNITHETLKEMSDKNLLDCVITQNIDRFDLDVGIKNVLELHGSIKRNYCMKCGLFYDGDYVFNSSGIPKCRCGGIIKPDVVLYGEGLDDMILANAIKEVSSCQLLIIAGTSLAVYPAASLINYFKGKHLVIINRDITPYDNVADLVIKSDISEVFKKIKNNI